MTRSIYVFLVNNDQRIYHNATKHGHSTKLLHKESLKFQDTIALETGGYFSLLILPWANGDTTEDRDLSLGASCAHRLSSSHQLCCCFPHLLLRLKLFSPSVCQGKTWTDPISRASVAPATSGAHKSCRQHFASREEGDKEQKPETKASPPSHAEQSWRQASKWSLIILFWDHCLPPHMLPARRGWHRA